MLALVDEGKVRLAGLSNFDTHAAGSLRGRRSRRLAAGTLLADSSRDRRARDSLVPGARDRRDLLQPDADRDSYRHFQRGSRGSAWRRTTGAAIPRSSRSPSCRPTFCCAMRCGRLRRRHGTTVSAIAVAWTIATPGVTGAIVGARSAEQVDGWIDAARVALTAGDLAEIAEAVSRQQSPQPAS